MWPLVERAREEGEKGNLFEALTLQWQCQKLSKSSQLVCSIRANTLLFQDSSCLRLKLLALIEDWNSAIRLKNSLKNSDLADDRSALEYSSSAENV